jgi:hypothetical protein
MWPLLAGFLSLEIDFHILQLLGHLAILLII